MIIGKYNTIKYNDVANAPGIAISIYLQGCPHHCKGCFNPETWNFNDGQNLTTEILEDIFENKIYENNIERSLCILGGEPLCAENNVTTFQIISWALEKQIKIYIWTGYTLEELKQKNDDITNIILERIDYLIDGPFIEEEKDLTLKMRGSRNQRIWDMKNKIDITEKI